MKSGWCPMMAATLLALALVAEGEGPHRRTPEEAARDSLRLAAALEAGRETKVFTELRQEIARQFTLPHEGEREAVLAWLGSHEWEIGTELVIELDEVYRKMYSTGVTSEDLKSSIADRRLRIAPREERARVYWEAVRKGESDYGARSKMNRASAIVRACAEGLGDFAGPAQAFAAEIDADLSLPGVKRSRMALWDAQLRRGARDGDDAVRLHAERVLEMDPKEFADLMSTDLEFRQTTLGLAQGTCPMERGGVLNEKRKPLTEACRTMARLYLAQAARGKEGSREPKPELLPDPARTEAARADWLTELGAWTANARDRMASEGSPGKADASNGLRK